MGEKGIIVKNGGPGRPAKPGRRVFVGLFLREGEHDEIIHRLAQLPRRSRSSYIRRVLNGAPAGLLDDALAAESAAVRAGLDGMARAWGDGDE